MDDALPVRVGGNHGVQRRTTRADISAAKHLGNVGQFLRESAARDNPVENSEPFRTLLWHLPATTGEDNLSGNMLTIRSDQILALQEPLFLRWLQRHVRDYFPVASAFLNQRELRDAIAQGVRRARSYGFVTPEDVCQYVDLMFALHADFDRDDGLPWAKDLLTDPEIAEPAVRMDLLTDAARDHLRNGSSN
jgi:hypothetical protein